MTKYINLICEAHGLQCISNRRVSGGDINKTYTVDTNRGLFFMKLNSASDFPLMFQKEAEGLKALQQASFCQMLHNLACQDYFRLQNQNLADRRYK